MPGMTGDELYGRLVDDGHAIPTILVTAYPNDPLRARVLNEGVVCYLHKPFEQNNLIGCVRKAIELGRRGDHGTHNIIYPGGTKTKMAGRGLGTSLAVPTIAFATCDRFVAIARVGTSA